MARIRTVKPTLFGSYTLARLPVEARYLFIGLLTEADDDGRLIDSPKRIAGAIFPHDEKVTVPKVNTWLNALQRVKCIFRYEAEKDGERGRYILIPTWESHQRISHPTLSLIPCPTSADLEKFLNGSGAPPV